MLRAFTLIRLRHIINTHLSLTTLGSTTPLNVKFHPPSCHFFGNGKIPRFGCSSPFSGVAKGVPCGTPSVLKIVPASQEDPQLWAHSRCKRWLIGSAGAALVSLS